MPSEVVPTDIHTFGRLVEIALEMTAERRRAPSDDLLTWVIQAEFEGERLEDWEIGAFFSLLAAAANDTTRHSISHALWAFEQHPEQKALLLEDLEGRVDQAVWYCSGNRDEAAFDEPDTFDIRRSPNKHLSFGGGGPHWCLGSNLARHTLRAALLEVYGRLPDITVSDPEFLVANFVHGIKRLQGSWTPSTAPAAAAA